MEKYYETKGIDSTKIKDDVTKNRGYCRHEMYWYTRYGSGAKSESSETKEVDDLKDSIASGHDSTDSNNMRWFFARCKNPKCNENPLSTIELALHVYHFTDY